MELSILKQMQSLTDIEKQQKDHRIFSDDIPPTVIDLQESKAVNVPVLNDYFFCNHAIYVSKNNRFTPYPLHSHQFFEMNYMLQGHADETVNGDRVHLFQGDVLLLDIGSQHAMDALGENDILINILFRDRNISLDFLSQIQSQQSVLYDFMINHLREKKPRNGTWFSVVACMIFRRHWSALSKNISNHEPLVTRLSSRN